MPSISTVQPFLLAPTSWSSSGAAFRRAEQERLLPCRSLQALPASLTDRNSLAFYWKKEQKGEFPRLVFTVCTGHSP